MAFCLSTAHLALAADVSPKVPLIVGSELDFPPFALVREGGRADGFTAELWQAVAREAHLDSTIKTGPFHQILEQFKRGQIDVLINLALSDERSRFADFSVPHVRMTGAVFTRKGDGAIAVEDDLANKSLIVINADLAHDYARMRGWSNLTLVDTAAAGMKLLANSTEHDAMLIGRLVGLNTIRELKLANIQPLPLEVGFQQDFAFAVREGNAELLARINDGLANVRASGAYDAIYAKWFGSLEPKPLTMEIVVKYLVPAVGVILLLLLAYLRERSLRMRWKNTAAALDATVTERMQTETALRESEERFKAFMDRAPGIAFIKDECGRYIYVNKTWEDIYALDWRGKTDAELWPRDNVAMFAESDRRALEAGAATEAFETVLDKDGQPQDWWVMKFPVVDADGRRLLGGMAMDITERNAAEQALLASETKLRQVTDTIPGAVYQYQLRADGSQNFVSISDGVQNLIGHSAAAVVNDFALFWNALLAEGQEALSTSILRSAQTMLPWEFEGRVRLSNGSLKWIRGHSVPEPRRPDGSIVWNGILTDITERKRNELERARLAAIVENSQDAIISRDLDLNIITWNPAAERLFGYTADEAVGKSVELLIPRDKQAEVAHRRSQLTQGVETSPFDTVRIRRDGKRIDVSVTQSPIRDTSGTLVGVSLSLRDITERKRMEKSMHLTQFSIDRAVDGMFWILPSAEIIYVNDAACGILGYGREELIGKTVPDIDPSFPAGTWPAHWEELKQKGSLTFESNYRTKDGRPLTTELTVNYIVYDGEEYNCAIMRDVSARREAEDALRHAHGELERRVAERTAELQQAVTALKKTEAMLHQAVDVADVGIFERDHETDEVYYSPTLKKILGLPDDQPARVGDYLSRVHGDDRQMINLARQLAHQPSGNGQIFLEHRIARRDGSTGWVILRGQTFFAGTSDARRPMRTVGAVVDITDRRQSEDALRESETRLRAILDHNPGPVFIKDLAGRYLHVNRPFEDSFGIKGQSTLGKTDAELFSRDQAESFQRNDQRVIDAGTPIQFEETARHRDAEHTSLVNKFLLRDIEGKTYALCGIATDITERKAAEEALRKLNDQLDQRVAQRTQELAESRAGLRSLVSELTMTEERERRRLAVELHDTLAQSLAVVNMYLWRVRELVSSEGNDASINDVLANLDRTVDDSIKYTRSPIAELSPPVLYDLGLPAAFRWLGEQMGRHGLRVEVDGPADGFSLAESDAVFLFQCARELLWNVVKHGATDSAKVAYGHDSNRLSLVVVDQGKGFDLQTSHANRDGGNHFGLFSIRERVELRSGAFEINSSPRAGTWVSIVIPTDQKDVVTASIATPVRLPAMIQSAVGDAIRIVIVDDHKMVRQGLRRVLEEHKGFAIVGEAGDGAEGVALTRELVPHVVIMDVNLPTMSGIAATQDIIHDSPSTIVVGLSFGTDKYVLQAMQEAGAVTCIPKERAVEDVSQAIIDAVAVRMAAAAP